MKKRFTLFVSIVTALTFTTKAQVVLNEVYTDPGFGKNEFFEFYNTSASPVPENLDNYTLVTYYEEPGNKFGFYVLDLPNQTVAAKGYYVGASGNTFNVQGQTNLTPDFSWDAIPAGGSLKKFEKNGASYTQVSLPPSLNDIFVKRSGSGDVQHVFVFKNGLLINGVFSGASSATIPAYIKSMPPLFIDMSGASIDFVINFNAFNDNQFEYVISVAGSDNGYIRLSDGKCGVWDKSSAAAQHTPGVTNGSAVGLTGDLTITSYITDLGGDPTKSLLVYNITSGSLAAFPVTVEIYKDMGMPGQLDGFDLLIDSRSINTLTAGDQYVILDSRNESVILVAKTPSGCFDQVTAVSNSLSPLPVHLISFQGNMNKYNKVTLQWKVADNETVDRFEVQRSTNGSVFTTIGLVFASEKMGTENYMFYETVTTTEKVMYRLRMIDKQQDIDFSKILVFQNKANSNGNPIKVYGNPVNDKLTLSFTSSSTQSVDVKIYDMTGRMQMNQKVNSYEGSNMISLPLSSTFKPGLYVVEVNDGTERQTAKFVKQ